MRCAMSLHWQSLVSAIYTYMMNRRRFIVSDERKLTCCIDDVLLYQTCDSGHAPLMMFIVSDV